MFTIQKQVRVIFYVNCREGAFRLGDKIRVICCFD